MTGSAPPQTGFRGFVESPDSDGRHAINAITASEHNVLVRVNLDDLHIELIADQRVAVFPPGGSRRQRHGNAVGAGVRVILKDDDPGFCDSQGPIVVGVGDESMAVRQAASEGSAAELGAGARTVAPDDLVFLVHLDDALVVPVSDQNVPIAQKLSAIPISRGLLTFAPRLVQGACLILQQGGLGLVFILGASLFDLRLRLVELRLAEFDDRA